MELKADGIPEHEIYCGSRTEDCEECGKIFMLKFRNFHLDSNHRLTQPREGIAYLTAKIFNPFRQLRNNILIFFLLNLEVSSESDNDIEEVEEDFQNNYPTRFRKNSVPRNRENNHSHRSVPYENNLRRNQGRNSWNGLLICIYFN